MDSAVEGSPVISSRTGRVRRHARRQASADQEGFESDTTKHQQEVADLMAKNEALQREIDSMCHHDDREQLFRLVSKLDVEERARFGCRILEQAVSEMSREHANGQPHGWHGRTLEDVQAIRKSLLLQITEMANRDAAEVLQSKAPPQTPKSSNFVTSLQGQLSEAVAQHATRDPEWIKTDEHFSSAVADALDLKPFTEAALEMLEEVGIDDANKIRLKDLLRADQFDTHTTIVARRVAMQVCQAKGLVAAGGGLEDTDAKGLTALLRSAEQGNRAEMWLLLQAGADTRKRTKEGLAAVHIASGKGDVRCLQVLAAKGADLNQGDKDGRSAVHTACASNTVDSLQLLAEMKANLNHQDQEGRTPAHVCCEKDTPACLHLLAERGADLNTPDEASETPAHVAAARKSVQCLKVLIEHRVPLDRKEKADGDTPLHVAAYRGHPEAIRVLIAAGASLLTTNKAGNTALHTAAYWGHADAVQVLIDAKASPCAVNKKGWTPLDLADSQAKDDCVDILKAYKGWEPPKKSLPPPPPPKPNPPAAPAAPAAESPVAMRAGRSPNSQVECQSLVVESPDGEEKEERDADQSNGSESSREEARLRRERRRQLRQARGQGRSTSAEP